MPLARPLAAFLFCLTAFSATRAPAGMIVWDSATLSDPNGTPQAYDDVVTSGTSPWTFQDVDGSSVNVTLTPGGTLSNNHAMGGGAIHAYQDNNAGDPGPQIYTTNADTDFGTNAIRWTNGYDQPGGSHAATNQGSGFTLDFSEDVFLNSITIGSISRISGRLEGLVVEAYDGAGLTGNRVAAVSITPDIFVASGSAPADGNYWDLTNIGNSYQIIADPDVVQGGGGSGQYARAIFDFGTNKVRSIGFSHYGVSQSTGAWVSNPTSMFIGGDVSFTKATPEPSSIAMGLVALGMIPLRRRRKRQQHAPVGRG